MPTDQRRSNAYDLVISYDGSAKRRRTMEIRNYPFTKTRSYSIRRELTAMDLDNAFRSVSRFRADEIEPTSRLLRLK